MTKEKDDIPEEKAIGAEPVGAMPSGKFEVRKKGRKPGPKEKKAKPVYASKEANLEDISEILSKEDKERLKKRAQQNVLADLKKEAEEAFFAKEKRRALIRHKNKTGNPDDNEIVRFTCDLASYAQYILVNNVAYYHGFTYDVPRHVCRGLMEIAARTWDHDADIHGEKWNPRKRRNLQISGKNNGQPVEAA